MVIYWVTQLACLCLAVFLKAKQPTVRYFCSSLILWQKCMAFGNVFPCCFVPFFSRLLVAGGIALTMSMNRLMFTSQRESLWLLSPLCFPLDRDGRCCSALVLLFVAGQAGNWLEDAGGGRWAFTAASSSSSHVTSAYEQLSWCLLGVNKFL